MLRRMLSMDRSPSREHEMDPIKTNNLLADALLVFSRGPDVSDDEGVCDDEEAIGATDSPPPDDFGFFDSLDVGLADELGVRICKDNLRHNLTELARSMKHAVSVLEDIETGSLMGSEALAAVGNNLLLLWGAFLGRRDLVQVALDAGASVKFVEPQDGLSALHCSASSGAVECTLFLLKSGAGPNDAERGITPLHCAIAGSAVDTARILIEFGALATEPGLLHIAARVKSADCLQLLLSEGANPADTGEAGGWAPLHVAADAGAARCLKLLLEAGADVTARTPDRDASPLHLAAEGGHAECVELILAQSGTAARSVATAADRRGKTPLHLAARAQSIECAQLLLRQGAADPNARDVDMRTPLHAAVGRALFALEMVELLIEWHADVNASDKYGYTALHVAALNELTPCVNSLLTHGADVSAKTRGGTSALGVIARKTPASLDTLSRCFDTAISMHDPEASLREVELKLDFRHILRHSKIGETSFLKTFVDEGDQNVYLEHPLCQAFLHLKWLKIRKFYVGRMILWAVLTMFLSLYVLTKYTSSATESSRSNTSIPGVNPNASQTNMSTAPLSTYRKILAHPPVEVKWWILMVFTVLEALRKLHGLAGYSSLQRYIVQADNITEWLVLISVPVMTVYAPASASWWQTHVGAFSVLFAWTNFMVLIGQLPVFGTYVAMYTRVQAEVTKLLIAYSCLLIGFTISFCVTFRNQASFSDPLVGLIKVLVMMTGELEFTSMFDVGPDKTDRSTNSTSDLFSAYTIFVIFLLLVTIALMNLMVGIAVHDIQGLHKTATLSKLVSQANLISHIELALFNGYLPTAAKRLLRKSAFVSPSGYGVVMHVKPLNPRERRLPRPILQAAYAVAQRRRRGACRAPSSVTAITTRSSTFRRAGYSAPAYEIEATLSELVREVSELREAVRVSTALLADMAGRMSTRRTRANDNAPESQPTEDVRSPKPPGTNV